ncbi:NDP-sugar synthase [Bacteroidota bacterium]
MKALVLAAGLGKRLRPLTDELPKALIEINGTPMIAILIEKLKKSGINEIIINVHYKAEKLISYLESNNFKIPIHISDESNELLDTGGAIKKASDFFKNDFLVYNSDVLSDIDINALEQFHKKNKAIATLAVRERKSGRYLLFNDKMELSGWENIKTGEQIISTPDDPSLQNFAFSGIHIINPAILKYLPTQNVFSIIEVYLKACSREKIFGYLHNDDFWLDMGRPEDLSKAKEYFLKL